MEKKIKKGIKNLTRKDLVKNKIVSLALIIIGLIMTKFLEGDCTVLVLLAMLAGPLFFADENYIV